MTDGWTPQPDAGPSLGARVERVSRNPLVAIAAILFAAAAILFAAAAIAGIVARNALAELVAVILAVAAKPATTPASTEPAQT